jgi:hypothetical protein
MRGKGNGAEFTKHVFEVHVHRGNGRQIREFTRGINHGRDGDMSLAKAE